MNHTPEPGAAAGGTPGDEIPASEFSANEISGNETPGNEASDNEIPGNEAPGNEAPPTATDPGPDPGGPELPDGSEPDDTGPSLDAQSALVTEILHLISPLTDAATNPGHLARLLARTGWNPAAAGGQAAADVATWLETAASAVGGLQELAAHPPQDLAGLGRLLDVIGDTMALVRDVPPALGAFDAAAFAEDVVHYLVADWLGRHHEVLFCVLVLLGVLELPGDAGPQTAIVNENGEAVRTDLARARLRPGRLADLVRDPVAALRSIYLPNGLPDDEAADALAEKLLPRLGALLNALGAEVLVGLGVTEDTGLDEASVALGRRMLTFAIPVETAPGVTVETGATLGISSPKAGDLGVVLVPRGEVGVDQMLGGGWALRADLSGAGPGVALGPRGVTFSSDSTGRVRLGVELRKAGAGDAPAVLLGTATGSRLEIGGFRAWVTADLEIPADGGTVRDDVEVGLAADRAAVVVAGGDGDGFLKHVLPPDGLRAEFALGLRWSRRKGLAFTGSAGLDTTLPVNAGQGPLELLAVHLGLDATADPSLRAAVTASARLELGPVQVTVERIGLAAELTPADGNLGPVGLRAGFAPPKGAGLRIDARPVTGGGHLFFDPDKGEYAGVLALQLESVALKAVGLLTTKLPGGEEGFSLLILVSAEFTPVQLGFGFTLSGVGGLIGINRSVSAETLRAGLRERSLDPVLFPADPLGQATGIISALNAVFPPTPGRHVVGPMVRIGWGTPTLLTLDLGVLLELPAPVRLVLLGRLRMALPTEERPVVEINVDVLGVVDFERGEAAVDATLYDSRIAAFALTGDMAVRARWKGEPSFALSAGGFHPRFQRPTGFPELRRLSLSLLNGDNPRLRLEAYLALTSNTVQFGARVELHAAALGFSVDGMLAFDALVQFEPFGFQTDIVGQLTLKLGDRVLMGVAAEVGLSGPVPWHVRGRARFDTAFFGGEIAFDRAFGENAAPADPPAAVPVADRLEAALADPRNWTAQATGAGNTVVTLRELPDAKGMLIVHPLGGLSFTQRVAPLGVTLDHYGNAPVVGPPRLDLERELTVEDGTRAPGVTLRLAPTRDYFAPAQFVRMPDEEKIAAPAFERLEAGATAEGALARERDRQGVFASPLIYEEFPDGGDVTSPGTASGVAGLRAAASPAARRTGGNRFATAPRRLGVRDTAWAVHGGPQAPLGPRAERAPRGTTWAEAAEYRRRLAAPGLRIRPVTTPPAGEPALAGGAR
jgi:hypothetical protein